MDSSKLMAWTHMTNMTMVINWLPNHHHHSNLIPPFNNSIEI